MSIKLKTNNLTTLLASTAASSEEKKGENELTASDYIVTGAIAITAIAAVATCYKVYTDESNTNNTSK
tara:strand:+ start:1717 stop:1920 length:204 start_codon:yes stop_codon:yes gene_type:complete